MDVYIGTSQMKEKYSVYLLEKCENFIKALNFFSSGSHNKTTDEKLGRFLDQIEFWDWEIAELIYSFDSFDERSKSWGRGGIKESLHKKGILVKNSVEKLWVTPYNPVVAPYDKLNAVINRWNQMLTLCEERIMISKESVESFVNLGAQVMVNLDKYRKKELEK